MFDKRVKGHSGGGPSKNKPVMASKEEFHQFLQGEPTSKDGVIYIHIPFCDNICSFCSMNRTKLNDELDKYTEFLLKEFDKYGKFAYMQAKNIESVYFGGGTPTILKEKHLEPIINSIHKNFHISPTCEFSLESTLHNLSVSKARTLKKLGVNRFSIGIQTFSDKGRKILNRVHDKKGAVEHLSKIRENFDGMVCTDIIFNYPGQTIKEVLEDARIVRDLKIDSTSFYSLQFFEGSELAKNFTEDYYDVKHENALHNAFIQFLLDSNEYEILEYTKINRIGRDKYKYIRLSHAGEDILPIGKGSGGKVGNFSIYNVKEDMQMISKVSDTQKKRGKFGSLFQYDKISLDAIKSYLTDATFEELMAFFKKCEDKGYMHIKDGFLNYTLDGVFWGNSIAVEVMNISRKDFE